MSRLAIVTATTNLERAQPCLQSWLKNATERPALHIVLNGHSMAPHEAYDTLGYTSVANSHEYLGSVPAFRWGVDNALQTDAEIICALHDDFEILEDGWDQKVLRYFDRYPAMGLAGFGGATGLGAHDMYQKPYDPMSLARIGFRSDLVDAESHGMRSLLAEPVACLDGFSQIGRRDFWLGHPWSVCRPVAGIKPSVGSYSSAKRPWTVLDDLGVKHHFQDGALGCLAKRYGWETWYIPLRSKHWGGQTAVGDQGYQAWAKAQTEGGDQGFWHHAHKVCYEAFRDVLPIRT